jgi:hypothetical protein
LWRWIGYWFRRCAGFGFRRRNFDAQFVRDIEIVEPRFEPQSVRQRFFGAFEERQDSFGRGSERGKVNDVFTLQFFLDISEEFFDFLAVGIFQNAERVVIEVFVGPMLGGLEEVVEGEGVGLSGK